jgi:hypothetical protein
MQSELITQITHTHIYTKTHTHTHTICLLACYEFRHLFQLAVNCPWANVEI